MKMEYRNHKPYQTVDVFYKTLFGHKVYKVSLNGGFTCPNRDGKLGKGGCIYCSDMGSGDFAGSRNQPLELQYEQGKAMMAKKWPNGKPIVYFQANTNTYAPLSKLKELYEHALTLDKDIVGISIATRPDCLEDEVIDYLETLNRKYFVSVELGLETIHESSLLFINRCHGPNEFKEAVRRLRLRNLHTVAHIINGLPGEDKPMMLETIRFLNQLDIQGIKIHMLYIASNSRLSNVYRNNPFPLLTKQEYCDIVASQIEIMRPDLIIYRLTGDAPKDKLIAPLWTLKKFTITNDIEKLLRERKSYQGRICQDDQNH